MDSLPSKMEELMRFETEDHHEHNGSRSNEYFDFDNSMTKIDGLREKGRSWGTIGQIFGLSANAVRRRYLRRKAKL